MIPALLALGIAAVVRPVHARLVLIATAALCGLGGLAALADLLAGDGPDALALPLGFPGGTIVLAFDPLAGLFLLLLFACAAASAVYALDAHEAEDARSLPFLPPFVAAMALTLLAGDGFTLLFGFELMSLASWAMVLARHDEAASRDAAQLYLGMAFFSAACLIPAFALLASTHAGFDLRFAAIRAAMPPEGWRATAIFLLVLLGAGAKAGLAPLHVWLPPAHSAAPGHVSALMSGAMTKVALYVLIRLVLDLSGPAQPLWWSAPVLATGVASAVLGGLRANVEADLKTVLAASTIENVGLIAIGIGVALIGRAVDLPGLAALALGGALLHALNHGLFKTLLFLGASAAQHGAGSRLLGRLGGLIHAMPITAACVFVGGFGLAALPPGPGFASEWLLLQSLLAAPRAGGIAMQSMLVIVAMGMAMAAALAASAVVRLAGVAFLGRPRTPRAAAATEPGPCARGAMIGLALAVVLLGLLPGLALHLAAPALRGLTGSDSSDRAGLLGLAPAIGAYGYAVLGIAALLAAFGGGAFLILRRWGGSGVRRGPAWECGFAAPPPWLPFGDPATQYTDSSFAEPLQRTMGRALLAARGEDVRRRARGGGARAPARLVAGSRRNLAVPAGAAGQGRDRAHRGPFAVAHHPPHARPDLCDAGSVPRSDRLDAGVVTALLAAVAQVLHLALVLACAPLLAGFVRRLKARLLDRMGPPLLQPWRDLLRLVRKQRVIAENATLLFRAAPLVGFASIATVACLVPSFSFGMILAPASDLIVITGLLALARVASALAAMDVGTAFGGLGASRDMMFAVFAEPALLLVVFTLALLAGTTNLDLAATMMRDGALGLRVSLGLVLVALACVAIAENGRMPVDNPATHLELTMVHELQVLEYSGPDLALIDYTSALRFLAWLNLILSVFVPFGTASADAGPVAWIVGLAFWLAKIVLLAAALAVMEVSRAKMRLFRVPEFLGVAILLGLLAAMFLFVSTGFV